MTIQDDIKQYSSNRGADGYYKARGLTDETIKRFNLGFNGTNAVIPYNDSYYIERGLRGTFHRKLGGVEEPIFNACALAQSEPVFICEAPLDAISIEQAGGRAISIGGSAQLYKVSDQEQRAPYIIALDNDTKGEQLAQRLGQDLTNKGRFYIEGIDYQGKKDANELLQSDPHALAEEVERMAEQARLSFSGVFENRSQIDTATNENMADYIANDLLNDIADYTRQKPIKTGLKGIDGFTGGLYRALYVIGGVSGLGKTTLALQLADQAAMQAREVFYFSLEQTRLELASKSLARIISNGGRAVTALDIRRSKADAQSLADAIKRYREYAQHIHVITNARDLDAISGALSGAREPFVVIDYLQLIQAQGLSDKQKADNVIKGLKQIQLKHDAVMLAVSSFNRDNYLKAADYKSFKESGLIEYTADAVLGLQLAIVDDITKEDNSAREQVADAMAAHRREVVLKVLKNRLGISNGSIPLAYYPAIDTFENDQGAEPGA